MGQRREERPVEPLVLCTFLISDPGFDLLADALFGNKSTEDAALNLNPRGDDVERESRYRVWRAAGLVHKVNDAGGIPRRLIVARRV